MLALVRENKDLHKLDVDISNSELERLLREDPIERNEEIAAFIDLLDTIEGNFSLCLDGSWGSGKTIFVKQLAMVLGSVNPYCANKQAKFDLCECPYLGNVEPGTTYLPVYFNAWQCDYHDDPLPALATAIAESSIEGQGDIKSDPDVEKAVQSIRRALAGLLSPVIPESITKSLLSLLEDLRGKPLFEQHLFRAEQRKKAAELVEAILPERANKVLLLVDELDRCRPEYATRLLEETKALFVQDQVIVVYSANLNQLAKVVSGKYGEGFSKLFRVARRLPQERWLNCSGRSAQFVRMAAFMWKAVGGFRLWTVDTRSRTR